MNPDLNWTDPVAKPTATMLVLVGYRVWSAYKIYGVSEGAIMLEVQRLSDIPDEFELRIRKLAQKDDGFLAIKAPSRWMMTWYLPYSGEPKF